MFSLNAPAKINWFLFILGKRDDGYHNISSLMQCISIFDTLTFEESEGTEIISDAGIPLDENLIYKALIALREKTRCQKGVRITLKKNIPLAAGLGGGSSDAVYTLIGLGRLWGLNLTNAEMHGMALSLGSDMPFFLGGHAALIEGRGEKITPVDSLRSYALLLLKPDMEVSTRWAYSEGRELTKENYNIKLIVQALRAGDFSSFNSMVRNDLEAPVMRRYPVIKEMKQMLFEAGAVFTAMSGSGPTVFGVFNDRKAAEEAKDSIRADWSQVVSTLT